MWGRGGGYVWGWGGGFIYEKKNVRERDVAVY
jgi:hypothetical protein